MGIQLSSFECKEALAALKKLPYDERFEVFRMSIADEAQKHADRKYGPKTTRIKTWRALIGKSSQAGDRLPGDDHTELRKGKTVTYLSQPYHLHLKELRQIVRACDEYGLEVAITAGSWYRRGDTILVAYTRAT
jgi:hypothetical protein